MLRYIFVVKNLFLSAGLFLHTCLHYITIALNLILRNCAKAIALHRFEKLIEIVSIQGLENVAMEHEY